MTGLERFLFPEHKKVLAERAVHDELAAERGYFSIEGPVLGQWDELTFSVGQRRSGLVIPIWGVDGTVVNYQLRPDQPRVDAKGRPRKYEMPTDSVARVLDVPPRVRPFLHDVNCPLVITEGPMKADAAASHCLACVALLGVGLWRHGDWRRIALNGRHVVIAFDSDAEYKPEVLQQRDRLAKHLQELGARVHVAYLPDDVDGGKLGLDDWLATHLPPERRFGWCYDDLYKLVVPYVPSQQKDVGLRFRDIEEIAASRQPVSWLVKGWWLDGAAGVVGGAEKSLKTWFLVMLAVAVASGKPFLNVEEYGVPERRRVTFITGEGGADLIHDRVVHACKHYGIPLTELHGWLRVSDDIAPTQSEAFKSDLTVEMDLHDPGMVLVDPAYVYLAVGDEASNVYRMGKLLADLTELCRGRALVVAHHFRKAVGQEPGLVDLTQAGFREWAPTWVLLWHRENPDLDLQSFQLGMTWGSRRGYGGRQGLDVELGPLDPELLVHRGEPRWSLVDLPVAGTKTVTDRDLRRVLDAIATLERLGKLASTRAVRMAAGMQNERAKDVLEVAAQQSYVVSEDGPRKAIVWSLTGWGQAHLERGDRPREPLDPEPGG